ncbi:NADH dehydrogenase subunit 6 (mitochondrion) [Fragariocoptes setiger]|uniref:NADH dehydrogenase subunit 6 n=1 Tax=Fragariocoptes setiger TaxID=1670756 RepID=A0ABQ7SDC7_9ACAR|nr:NADH dehydrogenase subunit 6 [Fragariocoptes setiger]
MLMTMMVLTSVSYIFMNNPMFCCCSLIFFSFFSGWYIMLMTGVSWIIYMFLLIFLGGIIVMFVFFCSVLPNEFSFSYVNMFTSLLIFFSIIFYNGMDFDGLVHSLKLFYSCVGLNYFFVFFILIYFSFFSFFTYSKGFSMRT